ncbi:MAG: arginase family protein [Candidatus Aenigmatarchaeota archaeon]
MNFDLFGICFDRTQTCRKGAAKAPLLIRNVFPKLETFVSGIDLSEKAFMNDLGNIKSKNIDIMIKETITKLKNSENFPIILGGEHTISLAGVKALPRIKSFVSFDAHPDCENSEGHDGVARNIAKEIGEKNVYLYGVRCRSKDENDFLKKSKVNIVKNVSELKKIPAPIYLSIDFDILDPSILPAVGNPEPDGLKFNEVMEAVKILAPKLVAVDFVEFTPLGVKELDEIYAMIAGKMIYETMAEIVKAKNR